MKHPEDTTKAGPLALSLHAGLGPLPEADVMWEDGKDQWGYAEYSHAYSAEAMHAYAAEQVAVERERCAKMSDEYATWGGSNFAAWFTKLAAAIRA